MESEMKFNKESMIIRRQSSKNERVYPYPNIRMAPENASDTIKEIEKHKSGLRKSPVKTIIKNIPEKVYSIEEQPTELKRPRVVLRRYLGGEGYNKNRFWSMINPHDVDGPTIQSRKRKRGVADLDKKHILRCLTCGSVERNGYKYGDYIVCSVCGTNDFTVVAELDTHIADVSEEEY